MRKQFFRVKQLADQTFLRVEKSETLINEELQIADHKIEYLKTVLTAINKKLPPSGPNNDSEKRAKKNFEYQLGTTFLELSSRKRESELNESDIAECKLFQEIVKDAGHLQQDLGKEYAEHEFKVEELISKPIQKLIEKDFPNIFKQKRNLTKYSLDYDSASSRYNATKKETLRDEMDEADSKLEQCRDILAIDMFNLLVRENEFASFILQLLKLQRGYHESSLKSLQNMIPELEKKIGSSNVRRVFGISLQEHLRVTGRHIAYPLEICITALTEIGLLEEGLFRLTGSMSKVKRLKTSIDSGCFASLIPEYRDVHVIASVLKQYLRELPEPLLTFKLYNDWMQVMQYPENQRLDIVQKLLLKLPKENMDNLTYLIQFFAKLSQNTINKMSSSNIAIVIAPNLLWGQNDDAGINMGHCAVTNMLVELFIKEVDTLFSENMSKYLSPLNLFEEEDRHYKMDNDLNVSSESIHTVDSPRPNTRRKKAAPIPPHPTSKTDNDLVSRKPERNATVHSYPSGSTTLNRPKQTKNIVSVGTSTEPYQGVLRKPSFHHQQESILENYYSEPNETILVNIAKNSDIKIASQLETKSPLLETGCSMTSFHTTAIHTIGNDNLKQNRPAAAARTMTDVINPKQTKNLNRTEVSPSILQENFGDVQLRRVDAIERLVNKPEVPARPASLQQKRSSFELPLETLVALQKTQCTLHSVASKQQPSYVNIPNKQEKYQLGHDNQIVEKEKFLGHHPSSDKLGTHAIRNKVENKLADTNTNRNSNGSESFTTPVPEHALPLKCLNSKPLPENINVAPTTENVIQQHMSTSVKFRQSVAVETPRHLLTNSNEQLNQNVGELINGTKKTSHARTRSDGNLIGLHNSDISSMGQFHSPPSPRSINKPTEPPPAPPVAYVHKSKSELDSTDL